MSNIISFFQKLIKGGGGGWNKSGGGGWKIFQKLISGRDDYSVLESTENRAITAIDFLSCKCR